MTALLTLTLLSLGCGGDAPSTDQASTPPAPQEVATPAVAVPAAPAAAAGALKSLPHGEGHCAESEAVIFDCTAKGSGKRLSVCASDDAKAVQYRFGRLKDLELAFPEDSSPAAFKGEHETFATGEGYNLSFTNEGHDFQLTTGYGAGEGWEKLTVTKEGRAVATISCVETGTSEGVNRLSDLIPLL